MVFWLGVQEPFETTTRTSFPDIGEYSMKGVRFLNPDSLDGATKVSIGGQMTKGYPVDPETVPKQVCWHSGTRKMPDIITCAGGSLLISQRVHDIIEQFEPGVHQLLPVDVWRPKALKAKEPPFARCYWMVITQRIDSVDEEHTTFERSGGIRKDGSTWVGGWKFDGDPTKKIVYSLSTIAGRHLWIDPFVLIRHLSTTLGQVFLDAEISGIILTQVEDI